MNFFRKYKNIVGNILFVLFIALILFLSVRGLPGNPTPAQLNTPNWVSNGPFELSNERGRYALIYSIVENHSFHLQPLLANFAAPDIGYWDNHYVSLFAPSVSTVGIPGFIIGKYFGLSQFGTFLWLSLFALFNVLLIRAIAVRLGAHPIAAFIGGMTFLFATPAFAYAVTMYEHHVSTFFILLGLYLLIRFNNVVSLFIIWILYAFAFTADYPNLFMMFPVALAAFLRSGVIERVNKKVFFRISLPRLFVVLGVVLPLAYFLWFNQVSYNNPFKISGAVGRVESVMSNGLPVMWGSTVQKQASKTSQNANEAPPGLIFSFFLPRNMLNGLYILLISPDRGVLIFTPIILLSIAGVFVANKKKVKYTAVLLGIMSIDLILYSMWGDPYGGWAFGARYLIPAYAIASIFIAILLTYAVKNRILLLLFFVIFSYSVMVNTLGALTSNSNPPEIEAVAIAKISHQPVSYTYMRNVNDLNANISRSFVFQTYAKNYMSAWQYYSYIVVFILTISSFFIIFYSAAIKKKHQKDQ